MDTSCTDNHAQGHASTTKHKIKLMQRRKMTVEF